MGKNVLLISTVWPFPVDAGKKVVLAGLVEYFVKYKKDNLTYLLIGDNPNSEFKDEIKVIKLNKPNLLIQIANVLWFSFIRRKKTIQESVLYSESIQEKMTELINKSDTDIIIYDTIRIAQYFEKIKFDNGKKEILYLDDLFSIRYSKMLEAISQYKDTSIDVLGNFKKFIPNFLLPLINNNVIQKLLLHYEKGLIKRREDSIVKRFDKNLLINSEEVNILKNRSKQSNIYEIKPLLNYDIGTNRKTSLNKNNQQFIFLGSLNIPHNSLSIIFFIKSQMEKILEILPEFKLKIVGKYPSEELIKLANEYKNNIEILGYVEDLDELFNNSCGMIIPLLFGSGVKLKTLEAFSKGLPVVSTDFGIEGIKVENGENCFVTNDIDKFPYYMKKLTNPEENEILSYNSRNFYQTKYSKEAIYKEYDKIFSI